MCGCVEESSAQGAAYMAGLAVGLWSRPEEFLAERKTGAVYCPAMEPQTRERTLQGWRRAVQRTRDNKRETED